MFLHVLLLFRFSSSPFQVFCAHALLSIGYKAIQNMRDNDENRRYQLYYYFPLTEHIIHTDKKYPSHTTTKTRTTN